jgi:hypothetical protein
MENREDERAKTCDELAMTKSMAEWTKRTTNRVDLAMVMDFKEVIQTSPTELAHCGRGLGLGLASGVLGLASGELEKPKGRVGR